MSTVNKAKTRVEPAIMFCPIESPLHSGADVTCYGAVAAANGESIKEISLDSPIVCWSDQDKLNVGGRRLETLTKKQCSAAPAQTLSGRFQEDIDKHDDDKEVVACFQQPQPEEDEISIGKKFVPIQLSPLSLGLMLLLSPR